jgi:hypothetical protein
MLLVAIQRQPLKKSESAARYLDSLHQPGMIPTPANQQTTAGTGLLHTAPFFPSR